MAESDAHKPDAIKPAAANARLQQADDELPVVARLVIEIRSDGTRTVARGGLEQAGLGEGPAPERVAIEARGGSPAALAADLLRAIITMPFTSSLSRWTGRDGQVAKASLEPKAGAPDSPGLVGRVRRELSGRLRRRLGGSR